MKTMKRFAAIAAATVMSVSTVVATASFSAFAADANTITVTEAKKNHSYTAYQIFKGTYANDVLTSVEWGSAITDNGVALRTALQANTTLKGISEIAALTASSTAADFADAFSKISSNTSKTGANTEANILASVIEGVVDKTKGAKANNGQFADVENGYYLITDSIDTITTGDSISRSILQVEGSTAITLKQDAPTLEKKVIDVDDTAGTKTGWQDSADMDIGDLVEFQLTGTLPADYAAYDSYYYKFTDTFTDGLKLDKTTFKVMAGSNELASTDYTVTETANGFTLEISNLKTANSALTTSDKVVVTYKAKLTDKAKIGSAGNPNTAKLTYSNNPNIGQGGETNTGDTPDDTVIVFTYEAIVNKVDGAKNPLEGANFELLKKNSAGIYESVTKITANTSKFEFKGIDAGEYKLVEIKTPSDEYNKIDDIYFTVTAEHDVTADAPKLTKLVATSTKADFTVDANNGTLTTEVINKKGASLPTTGSIGTKIFYGTGATIALGAGVLLIAKKRAKKD